MLNKVYENIKHFFKDNYRILVFFIILNVILIIPLPYYVFIGGGIMDTNDKINIKDSYQKDGSLNLAYVEQINGTVSSFLLSYIMPGWDIEKVDSNQIDDTKENKRDMEYRDQKLLEIANNTATSVAYKLANKDIDIKEKQYVVLYILQDIDKSLKVGDLVLKYDGIPLDDYNNFCNYIETKNIDDNINLEIKRSNKVFNINIKVKNISGQKKLGIGLYEMLQYNTNPKITFNFDNKESGPSGGLMMTLAIVNKLVPDDITKGLKIAGTGTVMEDGTVGQIDGVKYKLKGAVKAKADIFLVPLGNNYDEAIALKKDKHYDINIIGVNSVLDAINKLKAL